MTGILTNLRALTLRALRARTATIDGVLVSTDPNDPLLRPIRAKIFKGVYEAPERALLKMLLTPEDRVLDIGACTGLIASLSAMTVGSENVVAYEANPRLQKLILCNFALNGVSPHLHMKAITADGRAVTLHITGNLFSSSLIDRQHQTDTESIPSEPIAAVLEKERPTLVSMDVEGAEEELIGATEFPGVRKILIETHPHIVDPEQPARVVRRLAALGFQQLRTEGDSLALIRS
ncbi:FkbM family methyltransferase [Flaviflagellibacter deserti]|uniref:FkbM family methyltransferase n=1 Tax=Flaviflagellibacter deserti TaxID=2267266 RepID=A0ABV9Z613_9HYPH